MECIYFSVEDVTPWHGDVFGHPEYKYYCNRMDKAKEIFPWTCSKCPYCKTERKEV